MIDASDSRWIRIKDLFAAAIELTPESRAEWIARTCADDLSSGPLKHGAGPSGSSPRS